MKKEKFMMTRRGEFRPRVMGPHHCGVADPGEFQDIQYVVQVTCSGKLDERGFLFEQRSVHERIKLIRRTEMSCEDLSKYIAGVLLNMIHKENPRCEVHKISVTLSAAPYAADMTYTRKF